VLVTGAPSYARGMRAVHVVVTGFVQGVGFRCSTCHVAERFGVSGWVRNRPDGSVELHVEGGGTDVGAILSWLRHGPAGARVDAVAVEDAAVEGSIGFAIR